MPDYRLDDCRLLDEGLRTAVTLVPLKSLKLNFLEELFLHADVGALFAGQVLFEAGSYDKRHVYLLHGRIELRYDDGHSEVIYGRNAESAVAPKVPRPCRAVALTDCSILTLESDRLDQILSWSQIAQYLMADIAAQRDYDEDISWMQTVLDSNLFFKVPPVNVERIFSRLTPMVVYAGEVVVREGEIGDCCYFIKEGTAEVARRGENHHHSHIADIGEGRCFGEDALVYETVRNASVTMTSDGVLMRLEKSDFLLLLKEPPVDEVTRDALADAGTVLVDVRTEDEYESGHLERAANIPLQLLGLKKRLLSGERPYIFYCDTGRRSRAAAHLLGRQGYQTAALKGGLRGSGLMDELVTETDYILRDGELLSGQ